MSDSHEDIWTERVQEVSGKFEFPPTPDVAGAVRKRIERAPRRRTARRLAQALAALLLVALVIVLAVPDLRAKALDLLQIGAVRIVEEERPTPTGWYDPLMNPQHFTSLDDAQAQVDFPIRLPPDLGPPDRVYLVPLQVPAVIAAWDGHEPPVSLHLLGVEHVAVKYTLGDRIETRVNGQRALWLVEPHLYTMYLPDNSRIDRAVRGNVLLWESDGITYRLEGDLTFDTARQLAESLR